MIISGGAQGAVTLMQAVLGLRGSTRKALVAAKDAKATTEKINAQAATATAKVNKEKAMNEWIGMTIKKLLANQGKTVANLATKLN